MGQFMEALNNQTVLDDLGLNIDTFQGELPNVDEVGAVSFNRRHRATQLIHQCTFQVIKHELSMDGSLDFNFPMQTNQQQQLPQLSNTNVSMMGTESGLQIGNTNVVSAAVVGTQNMSYSTATRSSVTTPSWVH